MAMIYLDNNATTRPLPAVRDAVMEVLGDGFANPSSIHGPGESAKGLITEARAGVASLLGARETEIVFTSCATESINAALRGAVAATGKERPRVLITAVEHEAVHDIGQWLEAEGVEVVVIPVDGGGVLDLVRLEQELRIETDVVSLIYANNETGVITPVEEATRIARARGAMVHVDAVQVVGKIPLDVAALGCDMLSLSGHKFHAPKGIGVLYLRRDARFRPFVVGAGQEGGRRGGTENVPGIVGIGAAAVHMAAGIPERRDHLGRLSGRLEERLLSIPDSRLNGLPAGRVPGTVNVSFRGIEGSAVVLTAARAGVCLSAGSACSAAQYGGSHVLEAMGVPFEYLHGAVRFSCCETTSLAEVEEACGVVETAVAYLRSMDPSAAK